jgi:hypothetical protein
LLTGRRIPPEALGEAIGYDRDRLPAFVGIIAKDEVSQKLLPAMREALRQWPRLLLAAEKIAEQIRRDHASVRQQARYHYIAASIVAIIGFVIIFAGIALTWIDGQRWPSSLVNASTGLILEVLAFLFFVRLDRANERMDWYHHEIDQIYKLELLVTMGEQLPDATRLRALEKIVLNAADRWFFGATAPSAVADSVRRVGMSSNLV